MSYPVLMLMNIHYFRWDTSVAASCEVFLPVCFMHGVTCRNASHLTESFQHFIIMIMFIMFLAWHLIEHCVAMVTGLL